MRTHVAEVDRRAEELPPDRKVPLMRTLIRKARAQAADCLNTCKLRIRLKRVRELNDRHAGAFERECFGRLPRSTRLIQSEQAGPELRVYAVSRADHRIRAAEGSDRKSNARTPVI